MNNSTRAKYISSVVLVVSVFFLQWWAVTVLLFLAFVFFRTFSVGIAVALLMDIYYGSPSGVDFLFPFLYSACLLALCLFLLKRRMVFWHAPYI